MALARVHDRCMGWARRYGSAFSLSKYELIHLTRHAKKFNLAATITLEGTTVSPAPHVRVLGVEIDSKLKWGPHVRKVQSKLEWQTSAITRIAASTWGATFQKARLVYKQWYDQRSHTERQSGSHPKGRRRQSHRSYAS